jgi:hypothetical protein
MAKIESISLKGCSGTSYEFNVYEYGTNFNSFGAIYFISTRQKGKHTPIYIGITDDLSTRFNDHHKEECFIKYGSNCISVHQETSEAARKSIEEDILCYYDFPCNEINN